jgi:hypothetical protein
MLCVTFIRGKIKLHHENLLGRLRKMRLFGDMGLLEGCGVYGISVAKSNKA